MFRIERVSTFFLYVMGLIFLTSFSSSCVGTIEDMNPPTTKSATTAGEPVPFSGIVEAVAISDSKVTLSFLPAAGKQTNLVYLIYINNSNTPLEVKGGSLSPNESGYYTYTVTKLSVNTTYSFAVGVRDLTTGVESDENKEMFATTFSNYTADFDGIGSVVPAAGEAGTEEVIVEWIPAITKGAGSFPKPTDPIAYEIRYMKAENGKPGDLKNGADPDVTVTMVPSTISSSSPVSTERKRPVGGLQSGTKYYFMVRCIHKGYALYGSDPNYKVEQNLKILSVTTTDEGGLLEWDNESVKVEAPDGEAGLTKADVSWAKASGPFQFYRVFFVKIGEANALDPNDDGVDDKTLDELADEAPEFDSAYLQSIVDGTTAETSGFKDVDSENAYYRLGQDSSLTSYGYYKISTYVCTNSSCAEGFRIPGNEVIYRVTPSLAPFSGLLAIKSPGDLSQVDNPGTTDTVTVTFDPPVVSAGYVNKFELYCFESLDDTSPTLLEEGVANTSGKDGCNGLVRTTPTPSGISAIGEFGEIEIQADFIPSGKTASTRKYCFGAIPVIESSNYIRRDIGNATVRCKIIEIKVPSLDEFTGVNDSCIAGTTTLDASWNEPSNGIYENYEVFWKEVDGAGFKFSDAIAGDAAYSSADGIPSSTLSYQITGLTPGKSYQYGVLTYIEDDSGNKTYSEFNAGTKSCALSYPEPRFGEWVDIFAIGPKEDGRAPLKDSTGERTFLFETIDSLGQAIEVEVDSDLNPTNDHKNMFGDNSVSTGTFDGVWGKPNADVDQLVRHRYSNSGIIRLMWKDVSFDGGSKSLNDYIVEFGDNALAKRNRLFGYKVLRSEDEGITWTDLTSEDYDFQTSTNSGLIHPKDFTEYARPNITPAPDPFKVGEFIDYSVKYSANNGNTERARVYWYKIVPVFNGKEIRYERTDSNPQHIMKVVLPPPNMGLVHRLMANRQTCMELGKSYSTEIEDFYTCPYNGVGAKSLNTPWVVGSTVYDFGGNILMDRYEMGCNYTRGDQTNTRSYFPGAKYEFSGLNSEGSQFRGCAIPETSSGPSDNNGNSSNAWDSERVYWTGDCLTNNYSEIASSTCNDPTKANPRDYITPGITYGYPVGDCDDPTSLTNTITNPYDSNTGDYKTYLAQSEYLAVNFNTIAKNREYDTIIATSYHGAGGNSSTPSKHVTVPSDRVSRCMINIPVADNTSLNGDGEPRLQPRWIGVNNLDRLTHDGVDIDLLEMTVGEMEGLVSSTGAAGNLFDTGANALPNASYRSSYNNRYDSTTPMAKVVSSNKSKLPPLMGIAQAQAEKICDAYEVEIGYEKEDSFTVSTGTFNKRVMRRTEGIVATAPPKSLADTTVTDIEDGSYQHTPVTSGSSFRAGCNTYDRNHGNFGSLNDRGGDPLTPHMTDTRNSGTNRVPFYTGSSFHDPSGENYNTQACQGRYGIQDLMGNVSEYSSEHIFCDFSGERLYLGNGGTGSVSSSVEHGGGTGLDYNSGNIFPWIDSDPTTGRCSIAEFGADRNPANAPTESNVMLPTYDIFGNRNTDILLTPEFKDKTFMMDYRNGDGYFLDFGQGRIGAPLSVRDTLAISPWGSGETIFGRSNNGSDPREGRYFNPVIGMALSCYGDSCNSALDNKNITIDRFVNDFSLTPGDFDIANFPIRGSEFVSTGMSEKIDNTIYSLPTNLDRDHSYIDTVTPNGSGGGTLNGSTINLTTDTPLVIKRVYWELRRGASNTYGLYFQNFGGSESSIGVGRYTGLLGQEGHQNQMGVRESQGFRCVVKFDEQIY